MMNAETKIIEFAAYCVEMYSMQHRISGQETARKFEKYKVLDYLFANYEALHTQGWGYILPLIEDYITAQEQK